MQLFFFRIHSFDWQLKYYFSLKMQTLDLNCHIEKSNNLVVLTRLSENRLKKQQMSLIEQDLYNPCVIQ